MVAPIEWLKPLLYYYEAMGLVTVSNSASTVSSYVSIFETLWKQSRMYEESQNQLHTAEDELDRMKQYLNEALKEVASFKMTIRSSTFILFEISRLFL